MCGIAGSIGPDTTREVVERMNRMMHHRGPDDRGIFSEPGAAIGMTRLAIIDTSARGHQPMQSRCGRYWIVYNGECYNFKWLRTKLQREGDTFSSDSDTEVVLSAYVRYGPSCLEHFNGMYAFAVWDTVDKSLFAARDRFGIKPFYYCSTGSEFIFASEVKALLSSGRIEWSVDQEAVAQYFTFGHILQPRTIMESVSALMPGHYLTLENNKLSITKYWSLEKSRFEGDYEDAKRLILEKLDASVKMEMISDRPLGLFLSGGLDSATLLYLMNRHGIEANTFSIGFEGSSFATDESVHARELANFFKAKHTAVNVNGAMVLGELDNYFSASDQPTIDGLNTFFVSKYAVKDMTVALSGLGSDELFAGYSRHARAYWKSKNYSIVHRMINGMAGAMLPLSSNATVASFLLKVIYRTESSDAHRNYVLSRILNFPETTSGILKNSVRQGESWKSWLDKQMDYDCSSNTDFLEKSLQLEMQGFMSSMILRDSDAISMSHSLEVRYPFIDHEVAELAYSFPSEFKVGLSSKEIVGKEGTASYAKLGTKKILMDAMEPFLPKGFSSRPKIGFKIPLNVWLRKDMKERTRSIIEDRNQEGFNYLDPDKIEDTWRNFYKSERNDFTLWSIVAFLGNISRLKRIHSESRG